MKLVVTTPSTQIFEAYYYGYGEVVEQYELDSPGVYYGWRTVVDYGDDDYHAKYQQGRFQSGLYHAEIED